MKKDNQLKDIDVKTYVPSLMQGLVGPGIPVGVVSKHIAEHLSSEIEYNLTIINFRWLILIGSLLIYLFVMHEYAVTVAIINFVNYIIKVIHPHTCTCTCFAILSFHRIVPRIESEQDLATCTE